MTYQTIEQAAGALAMSPTALRKRCARGARKVGRDIVAQLGDGLGDGVVAVKFGRLEGQVLRCRLT